MFEILLDHFPNVLSIVMSKYTLRQFGLYCDKAWVPDMLPSIQGAGCLVGALIWGQFTDICCARIEAHTNYNTVK